MESVQEYKTGVARINTDTIINSSNDLTETQKRALLYFISKIDHNKVFLPNESIVVNIHFSDLIKGLGTFGIKWKDGKKKLGEFVDEVLGSKLMLLKNVEIDNKVLKNKAVYKYNWFSGIGELNQQYIEIRFNPEISMVIYNLNQFTRLYSNEFVKLKGKYTLDLFSLLVAIYGKQSKFKEKVVVDFTINELKEKLNIDLTDYTVFKNFRVRIVDYAINQINDFTSIYTWYEYLKEGKNITGFKFFMVNNYANSKLDYAPSNKEIGQLKIYEYEAYRILKNYGVVPGIIIKQIIPNLPKGVLKGFEDLFIKACIQDFELNTNQKTAKGKTGAFVQWFCQNKIYSQDNDITFNRIREKVLAKFKTLSAEEHNERSSNTNLTVLAKYGEQAVMEF